MDLSSVISSFKTGTYTVTRATAADTYTSGRLVTGATTTLQLDACVQPAGGRELQKLSEGERRREPKTIFCAVELRTRETGKADLVSIDGDTYEVIRCEVWGTLGAYWKALALKTGD